MANNKQAIIGLVALILVFANTPTSQAAESTANVSSLKAPIVVEADELYFSDSTGDLFAKGEVKVSQNSDQILTDTINGNTKQTKVWAEKATLLICGRIFWKCNKSSDKEDGKQMRKPIEYV